MVASLLIMLREGIEVALILGIVAAYLSAIDKKDWMRQVWLGALAAVALSVTVGTVAYVTAGELSADASHAVEAVAALAAVGMLTYMTFWMRNQARHIKGKLHSHIDKAVAVGSPFALAALAFFSVGREALETVLFMFTVVKANGLSGPAFGASLGLAISGSLGYGIYKGGVRIDLRKFFSYTSLLLIIIAAGLLLSAMHVLIVEMGVLPPLVKEVWNIGRILPSESGQGAGLAGIGVFLHAVFGYQEAPSLLELLAYITYLTAALFFYFKPEANASASRKRYSEKSESRASA